MRQCGTGWLLQVVLPVTGPEHHGPHWGSASVEDKPCKAQLSTALQLRVCQRKLSLLELESSRRSCPCDKLLFLYYVRPQSSPLTFCLGSAATFPKNHFSQYLLLQGTTLELIGIFWEPEGGWRPVVVPFYWLTEP